MISRKNDLLKFLQLAFVLNFLRDDLENLNFSPSFIDIYQENEIFSGPLSVYAQANFHNYQYHPYVHTKNYDSMLLDRGAIFEELNSLGRYSRHFPSPTNDIIAYLVEDGEVQAESVLSEPSISFQTISDPPLPLTPPTSSDDARTNSDDGSLFSDADLEESISGEDLMLNETARFISEELTDEDFNIIDGILHQENEVRVLRKDLILPSSLDRFSPSTELDFPELSPLDLLAQDEFFMKGTNDSDHYIEDNLGYEDFKLSPHFNAFNSTEFDLPSTFKSEYAQAPQEEDYGLDDECAQGATGVSRDLGGVENFSNIYPTNSSQLSIPSYDPSLSNISSSIMNNDTGYIYDADFYEQQYSQTWTDTVYDSNSYYAQPANILQNPHSSNFSAMMPPDYKNSPHQVFPDLTNASSMQEDRILARRQSQIEVYEPTIVPKQEPVNASYNSPAQLENSSYSGYYEANMPYYPSNYPMNIAHNHTYATNPVDNPSKFCTKERGKKKEKIEDTNTKDAKLLKDNSINLDVDDVINMPMEVFTDTVERMSLTPEQDHTVREIRRRGKNKVAAQNCRKRKIEQISILSVEVGALEEDKNRLEHKKYLKIQQINTYTEHLMLLKSYVLSQAGQLPSGLTELSSRKDNRNVANGNTSGRSKRTRAERK